MTELTKIQIINGADNKPAFVVIPYEDYTKLNNLHKIDLTNAVPSEVVDLVFDKGYSPIRAWREYLDVSQAQLAEKLGVTQAAISQYENTEKPSKAIKSKIASALGITYQQIDF